MKKRLSHHGFTLPELLVSLLFFSIIMGVILTSYKNMYTDYRQETKKIETGLETAVGLGILRLDVEHAGYGISCNETSYSLECDNCDDNNAVNRALIIRSTINSTNNKTIGWVCLNDGNVTDPDQTSYDSSYRFVFLDLNKAIVKNNVTWSNRPTTGFVLGFPLDGASLNSGCSNQACNKITYQLSSYLNSDSSSGIAYCNPYTRNLLRKVNDSTNGSHIIDCVADFIVRFDYDLNSNGDIDSNERILALSSITSQIGHLPTKNDIINHLKAVRIYVLSQEGKRDSSFQYSGNIVGGKLLYVDKDGDGICDTDDVCFSLPTGYQNYHWSPTSLIVRPVNL